MMEDRPLMELYDAKLEGSVEIDGRDHWIMLLEAKREGIVLS